MNDELKTENAFFTGENEKLNCRSNETHVEFDTACDEYTWAMLNRAEVKRLRDWLTAWLDHSK